MVRGQMIEIPLDRGDIKQIGISKSGHVCMNLLMQTLFSFLQDLLIDDESFIKAVDGNTTQAIEQVVEVADLFYQDEYWRKRISEAEMGGFLAEQNIKECPRDVLECLENIGESSEILRQENQSLTHRIYTLANLRYMNDMEAKRETKGFINVAIMNAQKDAKMLKRLLEKKLRVLLTINERWRQRETVAESIVEKRASKIQRHLMQTNPAHWDEFKKHLVRISIIASLLEEISTILNKNEKETHNYVDDKVTTLMRYCRDRIVQCRPEQVECGPYKVDRLEIDLENCILVLVPVIPRLKEVLYNSAQQNEMSSEVELSEEESLARQVSILNFGSHHSRRTQ